MADYGLGLGGYDQSTGGLGDPPPSPPPSDPPPQSPPPPTGGLGLITPPPAPNGGASGGAGGGFTPGQGLNWQGANPADLYGQFQALDPGLQQSYINYYMNNLDPTQQAAWRTAFGQEQPALAQANPQMGGALGQAGAQKNYPGAIADPSMGIHSQQSTQPGMGGTPPAPATQESAALGLGNAPPAGMGNIPSAGPAPAPGGMGSPALSQSTVPGGLGGPAPTELPAPQGYQIGNSNNAPGGPGTLQNALASPGDYWAQHRNDAFRAGANQGEYSPGSGVAGKDPWLQPNAHTKGYQIGPPTSVPERTMTLPDGRTITIPTHQQDGQLIKWDQTDGPGKGYTEAGRQEMKAPFSIGGQQFEHGLKSLMDYLRVSTPGEQALKTQLSGFDAQGGSLEPGEHTLFDEVAKYMGKDGLKMPTAGTPFTDWNPVGLLDLLKKAGLLT